MFTLQSAGRTDRTSRRGVQENRFFSHDSCFAIVDGVEGNQASDEAAQTALDVLWSTRRHSTNFDLRRAIQTANIEIQAGGKLESFDQRLETAIAAVEIDLSDARPEARIASVGNCSIYLVRGTLIWQLTNCNCRGLGRDLTVDVAVQRVPLRDRDRLVLCTSGVERELTKVHEHLVEYPYRAPEEIVDSLIEAVRLSGVRSTATTVVVEVFEQLNIAA